MFHEHFAFLDDNQIKTNSYISKVTMWFDTFLRIYEVLVMIVIRHFCVVKEITNVCPRDRSHLTLFTCFIYILDLFIVPTISCRSTSACVSFSQSVGLKSTETPGNRFEIMLF